MTNVLRRVGVLTAWLLLSAAPAGATGKKTARKGATCKQVKDALAAGKSEADVAKDLKVSEARMKACTTQAAKHGKSH